MREKRKSKMKRESGFTLVEVTIILLVLVILGTILLPQLGNYNRLARFVKVREDVGALCSVVKKMLDEVFQGGIRDELHTPMDSQEPGPGAGKPRVLRPARADPGTKPPQPRPLSPGMDAATVPAEGVQVRRLRAALLVADRRGSTRASTRAGCA